MTDGFTIDLSLKDCIIFIIFVHVVSLIGWAIAEVITRKTKVSFTTAVIISASIIAVLLFVLLAVAAK